MAKLGVNIDHVATIREARGIDYPDPVEAAAICESAGCDSIVCHLREDRRHIKDADVRRLRKTVGTRLNLEMSVAKDIVGIACKVKPDQVTLVPEKRKELTTEGGLDVVRYKKTISGVVKTLKKSGIETSLFVDPSVRQIDASRETGALIIEIHTGEYANAKNASAFSGELEKIRRAARYARSLGLEVNAGHGLNYENTRPVAEIAGMNELNIGHSIVARAVMVGLTQAVEEMLELVR
jgi:pyridoxine 5-phosphate synthase